jgi:hypothetical protein
VLKSVAVQPLCQLEDSDSALRGQGRRGNLPTLVLRTQQIGRRHFHVVEEQLAELGGAGGLFDRPYLDARAAHVH